MLRKILVPLDGSRLSGIVLPYLRDLAPRFDAQVNILGVGLGNKRRRVNQLLGEYVNNVTNSLRKDDIKAKAVILYGSPADNILDHANENSVGLIIMATHGRGGVTRWWLGSVAEKVISASSIPVLLIRSKRVKEAGTTGKLTFEKILAPLDGSDIGEAALPAVEMLATKTGASVSLLRVMAPLGTVEAGILGSDMRRFVEAMRDACEKYLRKVAQRLGEKGVKTTYEVIAGDPANGIIEYAKDNKVSLIAMSTHGRSGVARWVLGSVADKVLHESRVPMWLVRSPKMIQPRPEK